MMIQVTPTPGRRVRDPLSGNKVVPEAGETVIDSPHWRFLARVGDVTITPINAAPAVPGAARPVQQG